MVHIQRFTLGGGSSGYITQAAPTNFHDFWTAKILLSSESVDDYKVVSESERTALEESDAAWVEPPLAFIDQCVAAGAVYNHATGYFELNGLNDITYDDMMSVWRYTSGPLSSGENAYTTCRFRTNLKPVYSAYSVNVHSMFSLNPLLEVAVLPQYYSDAIHTNNIRDAFAGCTKLREIKTIIQVPQIATKYNGLYGTFDANASLETVWLKSVYDSFSLRDSPKLRLDCIKYLVENATNPNEITIDLHDDAYARLTDELFALAESKKIILQSPGNPHTVTDGGGSGSGYMD